MISLVNDTIDSDDINHLIQWLSQDPPPRLTKGQKTLEFEKKFAEYVGTKHAVYVNSGSSANLAMAFTLKELYSNRLINNKIVVPAVSWSTSISPFIQAGFDVIFCDADKSNLGLDLDTLEEIFIKEKPSTLLMVNVLGFVTDMDRLNALCLKWGVLLLEDSCETMGSTFNGKKTGTFGSMSTFSMFFGHHISTIEGGMVCTDDDEYYKILLMLRSHGWARDLDEKTQKEYKEKYKVDDFNNLYTFYLPAFNLRATDLQAVIGLKQLDKLDDIHEKRFANFKLYDKQINNSYWKVNPYTQYKDDIVSNFAYPVIHPKKNEIVKELIKNDIEVRPLICGSMAKQPFVITECINHPSYHRLDKLPFANNEVHEFGFYVPNNPGLTEDDINKVCSIINNFTKD